MTAEILSMDHGPDIIEGHLGGCSIGGDGGTYYPIVSHFIPRGLFFKNLNT